MRAFLTAAVGAALALSSMPAAAQDYPNRPIRVIAVQGPGGLSDVFMRALAEELRPGLGESVIVENRVGASGSIGARACADAPPDGYTFCIVNGESTIINPLIFKNAAYDPKKQHLIPVTRLFYITQVFALNASLGVKSFDELAALARAKPKTMNYMAPSLSKVAFMQEFNRKHGVDFVRVPFKGGGDAVNSMLTGTTPVTIIGIGNVIQLMRSGQIIGLAVDGTKRSPLAPSIPTFREIGYAEYFTAFFGIFAPAGTPRPIVDRMHKEIIKVASTPEFQQRHMISRGLTPALNSPEQFEKELETDRVDGVKVVEQSGLYPDFKRQ
jgi:tripartite-type tricarboxylate transporter receptor subunit TctC